jgi:hypothetical protein
MFRWEALLPLALAALGAPGPADGGESPAPAPHPFILWTREEAAAIKKRIETVPWIKDRAESFLNDDLDPDTRGTIGNLFRYLVLGDKAVVDSEKQLLVDFIATPPYQRDPFDWQWHHVDHYEMALRYDVLYDELNPGERRSIDATFRQMAVYGIENERIRQWEAYSRMASHAICALTTRDKRLIKATFESPGGLKSYFDGALDGLLPGGGNPGHKNLGHLMLWCRGVERLGLDEFGFGYKGPNGQTVRAILEGIFQLGDPRIEIPGGAPFFGRSAIGHVFSHHPLVPSFGPPGLFRAPIVIGRLPDGAGGWGEFWWGSPLPKAKKETKGDAKGPKGKAIVKGRPARAYSVFETGRQRMQLPLVFELAHQKWPDAGFDYFLAQMREPGDDKYYPSIYWGLDPIDPARVRPPAVKSALSPQSGFAILRVGEGVGYWNSPAPAAVLQLAVARGRGATGSCLALHSLHAYNRPIYRYHDQAAPGPHDGAGLYDAWNHGARRHSTVVVDNMLYGRVVREGQYEMAPVWPKPAGVLPIRSAFDDRVQFVAVRAKPRTVEVTTKVGETTKTTQEELALYPGVDMERGLMLTREYLFDTFRVAANKPRTYHWLIHAIGLAQPDDPAKWTPTRSLDQALGGGTAVGLPYHFEDARAHAAGGATWSMNVIQTCALPDPAKSILGAAWYDRKVGVRVTLLGEEGTTAYIARKPLARRFKSTPAAAKEDPARPAIRTKTYDDADRRVTEIEIPPAGAAPKLPPAPAPAAPPEPGSVGGAETEVAENPNEVGDTTVIAERRAAATTFVALHEPFENGRWSIDRVRRIQQTDGAVGVAVAGRDGSPVNDRLLLRFGDDPGKPATLAGDGESFTFADRAHVRIGRDRVVVSGDLRAMKVQVEGQPALVVNGKEQPAKVAGGFLLFGEP